MNCEDNINFANPGCTFDLGPQIGIVIVPKGTEIATSTAAGLDATWSTLLNAITTSRGYVINFTKGVFAFGNTPTADEPVFEDTQFGGIRVPVRDGNKRNVITGVNLNPYAIKALRSYNGKEWESFRIYKDYIVGRTDASGVKMYGFSIMYQAGNQSDNESGDVLGKFPIYIDYTNPAQFGDYMMVAIPSDFETEDMTGIENLEISIVSASSTDIVFDIKPLSSVKLFADRTGYTGLVDADFLLTLDSSGATVAHSGTVASTTIAGRYTTSGTFTLAAHSFGLKAQPDTTTKYVETPSTVTVTPA